MALKRSVITGCSVFACFLFATFLHPATELYKMVEDKKGFFLDLGLKVITLLFLASLLIIFALCVAKSDEEEEEGPVPPPPQNDEST
ncbi:hypothetical protein QR680_016668 [Steinernema hermaphroditum]|uniref:Uncharacterized protein n=1 Tax=Steinernema hermaphroditum TaxID=289476 RepID=A0AA39HBX1_9BILA|nr:hypothetical protein QR680_016668 [Steinernema hermaphroditum]